VDLLLRLLLLLLLTSQLSSSGRGGCGHTHCSVQRSFIAHRSTQLRAPNRSRQFFLLIFAAMATVEIQQAVIVHAALSLLVLRAEGKR